MTCWLLIQRVASRRDAQNERDRAGLRSSVAAATPSQQPAATPSQQPAATPSQLRRSSAARTMSGRRIIGQPLDGFATFWAVTEPERQTAFFHN